MTISLVDPTTPRFWLFVAAGSLILTPVIHAQIRNVLLAILNTAFLGTLLGRALLPMLTALAFVYALLCGMGKADTRRLCVPLMLLVAILLFVFHKLPFIVDGLGMKPLPPVLAAIGYSYVFLRTI